MKRLLHVLSGDDLSIIRQCDKKVQNRFAWIGALVACIIVISFISFTTALSRLFNSYIIGISVGVFFALVTANIYLLVLYTLSKNMLPYVASKGAKWVSITLRVFLIGVFALIVAKPFELLILSPVLEGDIEEYRNEEYARRMKTIESVYGQSFKDMDWLEKHGDKDSNSSKTILLSQKNADVKALKFRIYHSDFYVQQLRLLNSKHLITWVFTLFMIAVFLAPIYIKYFLPEQADFYQLKREIETRLVLEEYAAFEISYTKLWQKYFQALDQAPIERTARLNLVMAEIQRNNFEFDVDYHDPPFRTMRKIDSRKFGEQDILLDELYNV
ncbi:MAG: DUF4407 domain-containing protein [Bacteroidetes bacterium]|nr:DUF4407 domain-containing protein [Bacteroidota bacterium]